MTSVVDEVIDEILHMKAPYDPAKAHQYYEQHKHLKGRQPGTGKTSGPRRQGQGQSKPKAKMSSKALQQDVHGQRAALEKRLQNLKAELAKLVAAAKTRSGVHTKTPTTKKASSSTTKKSSKPKKPMTAAQKKAQAKRAKEARKKNPPAKKTTHTPQPSIAELEKQIADYRQKIEAAIADARKKTNSKTATKGR